jgi:peptidoglycan/LPS O-acetylase OafA/YrhL
MHTFGNRRDIDGLRALAVIPVVLYHYGLGVRGGFVGVDLFFVISGFLITSIIAREVTAGRFSFVDFWARRARRILPALSVVMLACVVFGWILLTPKAFAELGREVRYQAMFASNILFMRQDGYFEPASDFKPLLHTWSLAVEEQYYLFFPLIMVMLMRYLKHWRLGLLALTLVSFALSIWGIGHAPDKVFFLLPMRAWELLCGALLAVLPVSDRQFKPWLYQVVSGAGLSAVLLALFLFDRNTLFPGWAALLPVLGAAAMIWANGHCTTWVSRLLSARIFVGIGLISYSLYLWHWPVYVYASAISVDGMQAVDAVLWIALCMGLAWLSWRFIELPFREKRLLAGRRPVLVAGLVSMLVLAMAGQFVRSQDGFPQRLSGQALEYAQADDWSAGQMDCLLQSHKDDDRSLSQVCQFGGSSDAAPLQLIWGDSHAAALMPAIKAIAQRFGIPAALASLTGCPPLVSDALEAKCQAFNAQTLALIREKHVHDVVLVARWSLYLYGAEDGNRGNVMHADVSRVAAQKLMAQELSAQVSSLRQAGARVWLFKEVPLQRKGTIARLTSLAMIGRSAEHVGRPLADHLQRQQFISGLFDQLSAQDAQVHVIDPASLMCPQDICRAVIDGVSQYKDEDHLSDAGGERMKPLLAPVFVGENSP